MELGTGNWELAACSSIYELAYHVPVESHRFPVESSTHLARFPKESAVFERMTAAPMS
jgi:hypothetical protein